ncbi:MAG TPA: holo-ACP synthase [Acidimicrobiia bacterium]|nr:holo-ACP synthase [Acidimicrobiia bacterium]
MRLLGIGIDVADVERVGRLLERHPRFAERCFTAGERLHAFSHARPAERLAARFAGKEAVMKALGTGWREIRWQDVAITGGGAPRALLRGTAAARAGELGVGEVLVTLTHTGDLAVAVAMAVGAD